MQQIWLFQATPEYELSEQIPLRVSDGHVWHPKRYYSQMKKGDHVVLWQSGPEAGIYAFGKLKADPFKARSGWRVHINYDPLLRQPIFKRDLRRHPILRSLAILKMPRGTDFPVTPSEWGALKVLVKQDTLNILSHYKQQEDQFTNGMISLLELSTHESLSFIRSFMHDLLMLKPKGNIRGLRVLRDIDGTADAELCGTDFCIRFETKIKSDSLRVEQVRDHLKWLKRSWETQKTLVLLTPDDGGSNYIKEFLANKWIGRFCSNIHHKVLHLEWKDVYKYLQDAIKDRKETVFSHLVTQFLRQIHDRISEEDYAGIVQKVAFGDESEVYAETTAEHVGYLDEMKSGQWDRWNTPQLYKKLNGTGRKLLLYDKTREAVTVEVEIDEIKRTKQEQAYPFSNFFVSHTLEVYRTPIPLDHITKIPGFENFASGRAAAWNVTREQYRQLKAMNGA